jgi:hypothetical protein
MISMGIILAAIEIIINLLNPYRHGWGSCSLTVDYGKIMRRDFRLNGLTLIVS